jgi:hypothetical protein
MEKRWSKAFLSLIFCIANRSYKGLDRLANLMQAGPFLSMQENQDPLFCVTLLRYLAGGFPSAFLNIVIKAVTDS